MKRSEWGCYRDEETGIEIIRNVFEEDNDYGDKAGDIYYIVKGIDWHSDPISKLWRARDIASAAIQTIQRMKEVRK